MGIFDELNNIGSFDNNAFEKLKIIDPEENSFPDLFKNSDDIFNAPFQDTPFPSKSPQQIANDHYKDPCVDIDGQLKVYADDKANEELCNVKELEEVIIPSNLKVKEYNDFTIWMFYGSDGAKLLQQHNEAKPDANDLMIFLESDDDSNIFGSVMRIKVGKDLLGREDLPIKDILALADKKQVNIKPKKIKKLIKNGLFKTRRGVFAWLIDTISDTLGYLASEIHGLIGNFFFKSVPQFIDDYFRINERRWNPLNDKEEKRVNYDPLFISNTLLKAIDKLQDDSRSKDQEKLIDEFTNPFFKRVKTLENAVFKKLNGLVKSFPRRLLRKIKKSVRSIFDKVYALKDVFKNGAYNILELLKTGLQAANALLCGIWNSLIDTIKGILQLVGILFLGLKEIVDVQRNIGYYTALTVEYLENILESISEIDFLELYKQMFFVPISIAMKAYEFISTSSGVTIIEFFYFIGYIVGLIVETVISILFTGGSLTANRVLAKTFVEPFKALGKIFGSVIKGATSIFEKALRGISYILKKLANPKQLAADLLTFLNKLLGLGKKYADYVKDFLRPFLTELKIAKATIDLMADLGIIIIKNTKNLGKELAVVTPQGYTIRYNNTNILEGTEDTIKAFANKIDDIRKNSSSGSAKSNTKHYLDELAESLELRHKEILKNKKIKIERGKGTRKYVDVIEILDHKKTIRFRGTEQEVNQYLKIISKTDDELLKIVKSVIRNSTKFDTNKQALKLNSIVIKRSKNGLVPDFSKTPEFLYKGDIRYGKIKIKLTGVDSQDFKAANEIAKLSKKPKRYTWHHMDDFDPITGECTMQLVKSSIHTLTYPHKGGAKIWTEIFNIVYKNRKRRI